jgi:hypothetical protein
MVFLEVVSQGYFTEQQNAAHGVVIGTFCSDPFGNTHPYSLYWHHSCCLGSTPSGGGSVVVECVIICLLQNI